MNVLVLQIIFIGFGAFWLINVYIIWKGTETIRWLEGFAAPILILIGLAFLPLLL